MSDKNPLFDDLDAQLNAAYAEGAADQPNCHDVITVEHIGHDVERFTDEQMPPEVRQELLGLLERHKFEVKYYHRLGRRTKGSGAIVHFRNHVFSDGMEYLMYYSAQFLGEVLVWQIQAAFHVSEIFPYHWDE